MDYVFVNTDFFLETDIDYAALNFTSTKIVVPKVVIKELKKDKTDKAKKVLEDFENYKKLSWFIFDNEYDDDIIHFMKEYHCDKKYFASFSLDLLKKNKFDLFFECKEGFEKRSFFQATAEQFAKKMEDEAPKNDIAKNVLVLCYYYGFGVKKDLEQVLNIFKQVKKTGVDIGVNQNYYELQKKNYEKLRRRMDILKIFGFFTFLVPIIISIWLVSAEVITKTFGGILWGVGWVCSIIFVYISDQYKQKLKLLLDELLQIEEANQIAAESGNEEAQTRLKKKNIDDIVGELNANKIDGEHSRAKMWYYICLGLMGILLGGFAYFMHWNVTTINNGTCWQAIIVRVLISMSFLSMIFILMNQAARSRKTMVLLSKEIQEYIYIGALLKGKVDMSTDSVETNKAIDKTLDDMIKQHLYIQRKRLEKEDHSEVKDITPEVLTFFKDNTSSIMGNFNEMQKNILELQKTIVQTINNQKKE
ncbi:MAG: hypothetical protein J6T70_12625 [Bacteroidales bacterium]|nr:hypothetical protein [Bacteroidales bacterium]